MLLSKLAFEVYCQLLDVLVIFYMFDHDSLFVVLSVITALATYINYKFIKLIRPLG
ncbi:putative membrane protein [Francisella tularensis subsp. tularensis]|uniref:Membrane protein n=3 Tax=Francisella tularensis TaxID=263 RepID=A0AAI8BH43_FRATH|nr:hypothetical protein NE061598_03450 [Francisella tularensis subsp. tularensis NE061598]AFX70549.1 hypothetical protein F92_04810 [Francisella tularensis subsp. holarctica F92]AJI50744.1 putative membrane protein [Francisella tularensis subsp. holarctica]AJI58741.1 putative membrane protein [Francisella tularensis subsp. holarctica LVS]AJI63066.1 putative membrane protein [Francisella tularensis subsp. tularensis]AJI68961.1 putative membrane protein [Francisella tularensis subsp. tularensis 